MGVDGWMDGMGWDGDGRFGGGLFRDLDMGGAPAEVQGGRGRGTWRAATVVVEVIA